MALQMTEEVHREPARRGDRSRHGRGRGARPARAVRRVLRSSRAKAGLHRTSHASEDGPPANITTCLDVLGCERIDHGYHILEDDAVVDRCRDDGIHFTCCPTSTAIVYGWPDLTTHPINGMIEAGPARAPQLRRPDDVPHRHRQGVRRLRRPERLPARGGQDDGAQRRRRDLARRRPTRPRCATAFEAEIAALDKELVRCSRDAAVMLANTDPALRRGVARRRRAATRSVAIRCRCGCSARLGARAPARRPTARRRWSRSPTGARTGSRRSRPGTVDGRRRCGAATTAGASTPTARAPRSRRSASADHIPPRAARDRARRARRAATAWCSSRPEPPLTELLDLPMPPMPTASCTAQLEPIPARVGAGLMIDNFLDMAHFPFVHAATIGTDDALEVPELDGRTRRASA